MFILKITNAAKSDIIHAMNWYNKEKINLGHEFLEEVNQNFQIIQKNPQAFPVKYIPYHEVPLKRFPYIITYVIQKQNIIIKSIMSGKQHPVRKYRK